MKPKTSTGNKAVRMISNLLNDLRKDMRNGLANASRQRELQK
jgi:hypothetical protein